MILSVIKYLILFLVINLFSGCATYWQMKKVEREASSLQIQLRDLRHRSLQLHKEISDFKNKAEKIDENSQRTRVDLSTQIESLEQKLLSLNYKIDDINDRLALFFQKFDRQSNPDFGVDTLSKFSTSGISPDVFASGTDVKASELYKIAKMDLSKGQYVLAIQGFKEYVKRFPESELADNAQYWLGEVYYAQMDNKQAIEEFKKVVENYPRGDKVAAAFLKIGYCYFNLGDKTNAKKYMKIVIEKFPNSEEAQFAKSRHGE